VSKRGYKIGCWTNPGVWPSGDGPGQLQDGLHSDPVGWFLHRMYMSQSWTGYNWDNNPVSGWSWLGKTRQRGRYLPLEILWDPMCKVRNWGEWRANYSGTEKGRDEIARHWRALGYQFFLLPVNCPYYLKNPGARLHLLKAFGGDEGWAAEGPNGRPDTNNRQMKAFAMPSAWVATCQLPRNTSRRRFRSHFALMETIPGEWRFNILHLDGHVDSQPYRETVTTQEWLINAGGHQKGVAYGWRRENTMAGAEKGMLETPEFEGAFDQNAREFRKVDRGL
jgi:prepilin-type processing-associated H-X9-DG protein